MRIARLLSKTLCLPCLAVGLMVAGAATAQSTGNPKGTPPPVSSDSAKPPASRGSSTPAGSTDTGKLTTDKGSAEARMLTNRSPGTGTAGGLPKKNPADGRPIGNKTGPGSANAKPDPQ